MNEEAAQIAEEAARLISEHGHVKRNFGDDASGFCIQGSLYRASGLMSETGYLMGAEQYPILDGHGHKLYSEAMHAAEKRLQTSGLDTSPAYWNDREETSAEDVILLLKHVAEDLRDE